MSQRDLAGVPYQQAQADHDYCVQADDIDYVEVIRIGNQKRDDDNDQGRYYQAQ